MDQSATDRASCVISSIEDAIERLEQSQKSGKGRDPLDFPRSDLQNLRKALSSGDVDNAVYSAFMLGIFYMTMPRADLAVKANDVRILDVLASDPLKAFKETEIEAEFSVRREEMSRKTINSHLQRLEEDGLVCRPYGERGGRKITAKGEAVLRASASATH